MGTLDAAIKDWVNERPYLKEIAQLHEIITTIVEGDVAPEVAGADANWGRTVDEFKKGIPVLRANEINEAIIENAANLLIEIIDALTAVSLPDKIISYSQQAQAIFHKRTDLPGQLIEDVLENNSIQNNADLEEIDEGFIVFLAWSALSGALKPLKQQVAELLNDHQWRKGYCPVCGQLPAMGHLVRTEKGRERDLVCGCCQMKWRYRRIGCPYCDNSKQEQLKIIGLDDEPDLRIDTCEKCKCYLKTYTGEGKEQVALADWSTLHLDLIAKKHGFKRVGYQRYEV